MPRTRVVVVVSDFHLGRGDALDPFGRKAPTKSSPPPRSDARFRKFCRDLARYVTDENVELTVVMAGDMLDLWAIVPDAELNPAKTQLLRDNLEFPAPSPGRVKAALTRGEGQITQAFEAHPLIAQGIVELLSVPRTRMVFLPGNHDHAIVHPTLQDCIRGIISDVGGSPVGSRMEFDLWYDDPELRLYVEHGNQFSDDSDYARFDDFGEEAPGFYFLRFVWNRIRANYQSKDQPITEALAWAADATFGGKEPLPLGLRFFVDYFDAFEDRLIPRLAPQAPLQALHREWKRQGRDVKPDDLAAALVSVFKKTKGKQPGFTLQSPGKPLDGIGTVRSIRLPGRTVPVNWNARVDGYWQGAASLFRARHEPFPKLPVTDYSTIVMGHTHNAVYAFLPAAGVHAGRYVNSGSWTKDRDPTYMWVSNHGDPTEWRGLRVV